MLKAVLFDFDGTLADSIGAISGTFKRMKPVMEKEHGVSFDPDYAASLIGIPMPKLSESCVGKEKAEAFTALYRVMLEDVDKDGPKYFEGMIPLVEELRAKGLKIGIVTSRGKERVTKGLKKSNTAHLFDCLITADDVVKSKPEGEPAQKALMALGVKSDEAVMVGDTIYDMLCSKNAGVRPIAVSWGNDPVEKMAGEASYIANSVELLREELLKLI